MNTLEKINRAKQEVAEEILEKMNLKDFITMFNKNYE